MANIKEGTVDVVIGDRKLTLRFSFRALRELKERFGKSLPKYLADAGENFDPDDMATIFAAASKAGGTPATEDELLDSMDMAHLGDYAEALRIAMNAGNLGKADTPPAKDVPTAPFPEPKPEPTATQ